METSRVNDEVLLKYTNNHNGINNLIIQVLRQAHVRLHETTQIDHQRRKVRLKQLWRTAFQIRQFRARVQITRPPLLTDTIVHHCYLGVVYRLGWLDCCWVRFMRRKGAGIPTSPNSLHSFKNKCSYCSCPWGSGVAKSLYHSKGHEDKLL